MKPNDVSKVTGEEQNSYSDLRLLTPCPVLHSHAISQWGPLPASCTTRPCGSETRDYCSNCLLSRKMLFWGERVTDKCVAGTYFLRLGNGFRHLEQVTSALWISARVLWPRKLTSGPTGSEPSLAFQKSGALHIVKRAEKSDLKEDSSPGSQLNMGARRAGTQGE